MSNTVSLSRRDVRTAPGSAALSRLRKLSKMSLQELTGRGRLEAAKWLDRLASSRWSELSPEQLFAQHAPALARPGASLGLLRARMPARFFAGLESGASIEVLQQQLPHVAAELIRRASAIGLRRVDLLGYRDLALSERIDWHHDMVADVHAPAIHWSRVEPLNPVMVGDSKVTWELSRHQWLVTLAQAYWLTDDKRYAQEAADVLHDWIRANPYGIGINWASSLEAGYRLIAWCWILAMVRESGACSEQECAQLLAVIWLHAMHVERYLSYYFSPNTHLTGEALGLFYAGVLFPEFSEAARWRDLGRRILIDESRRQILPDGVYFEHATSYQRYTIDIYLHFLILAERNQIAVPVEVTERVERMLEVMLTLNHPDGSMPQMGDADGGWLLPLSMRDADDCRGSFGVAAALFGRTDFAWAARGLVPEVVWLLGPAGVNRFRALTPAPPSTSPSRLLESGGYAVMRSSWDREAHQLIVDVGPLGCTMSSAHGHADLLSVQCQAFGEHYLVDPGTFCYTPQPEWRDHFRGTAAHSTVVVDDRDQVEPRGPFSWHGRPVAHVRRWSSTREFDFVDAEHRGYASLDSPVVHRRRVLFVKPDYWVIVDDLTGGGEHKIDLRFQFSNRAVRLGPGLWASSSGSRGRGLWLAPFTSANVSASLRQGELDPIDGWISPDYGQREPAPVVVYSAYAAMPLRLITLLMPVSAMQTTPPAVSAIRSEDGMLSGLRLLDSDTAILVDDESIVATPSRMTAAANSGGGH